MNLKKYYSLIIICLIFLPIFLWNYSTFLGIKHNTGYAVGRIILTREEDKGSYYSIYAYKVGNKIYRGKQGGRYSVFDNYLIVFDKTTPKYSMIADYSYPVTIDSLGNLNKIYPFDVKYYWWDYLPVENVSDVWKKE